MGDDDIEPDIDYEFHKEELTISTNRPLGLNDIATFNMDLTWGKDPLPLGVSDSERVGRGYNQNPRVK